MSLCRVKTYHLWKRVSYLSLRGFCSGYSLGCPAPSGPPDLPGPPNSRSPPDSGLGEHGPSSQHMQHNMVGPPDPTSNMRPFRLREPTSDAEKELQEVQMETWAFNHEFWSKHNTEFEEKKAAFVEEVLKKNREVGQMSSETTKITAEELSLFYKDFLDSKYQEQMTFSKSWMKLNLKYTWAHLQYRLRTLLGYNKK